MSLKDLSDSLGTKKEQPKQQEQKPFDTHAQIKTIPAYKLMAIQFPDAFTDDINNHIDNVIIPSKVSHSSQLVGQINRNEKSEQYTFPLNDDVGKDFKTVVDRVATSLLRDKIGYARDSIAEAFEAWTVHSYEGDYNPLHDHDVSYDQKCMAFSIILYCMVPPQIAKLGGSTKLHSNGGATDGCTYFCWGTNTGADHLTLKPKTDRYVVPEEGKFLIFPSWLNLKQVEIYISKICLKERNNQNQR